MWTIFHKDLFRTHFASPVGLLTLVLSTEGLVAMLWGKTAGLLSEQASNPLAMEVCRQLDEYFYAKRREFSIRLCPEGTAFQKKAWAELCKIPYGKTISYQEQSRRLGDIKKARAVGLANSKNPLPIIVPCHRVITKDGALGGYNGGTAAKRFLLELEHST